MHPDDTIAALATAPGPGLRAILRLSQIDALRIAAADPPNLASAIRSWLFAARLTAPDPHATPRGTSGS